MTADTQTVDTGVTEKPKKVPPVVNTVKMEDGRSVEFTGEKRKMKKESFVDGNGKIGVRLDFINGKSITFGIPDAMAAKFAAHGAEQKLGDATAGCTDVDDMIASVERVIEQVSAGNWTAVSAGGDSMAGTSVLAKAIAEARGIDLQKVKDFLKTKTQKEKLALRANPAVKPIIERMEANKNSGVDTDALLASLGE